MRFGLLRHRRGGPAAAVLCALAFASGAAAATDGLVHRYLEAVPSPDGAYVAASEGDAPVSGYEPLVRALVIRRVDGGGAVTVPLPCAGQAECWPSGVAWAPDGKALAFALRQPGSHARSLYEVQPDGGGLTRLLEFDGTIGDLRYGPDGRLALLATEKATKEPGATQAGAPVTGDLDAPAPEQRIAILERGALRWASPADLYVYEYDWRPDGKGFVGTAAPGDGDSNWWVARLYGFEPGQPARELWAPPDARHQIADPRVSRDGRAVAFISGLMSDFGETGGDVWLLPLGGGAAQNLTSGLHASATSLGWDCAGRLLAGLLAGEHTEIADLGTAAAPAAPNVLWGGAESLDGPEAGVALGCPSAITAASHESFTRPPEIEVGRIGKWHDLTGANDGLAMPLEARSLTWRSDNLMVQGWLLLPAGAKGKLPMITIVHGGPAAAVTPRFAGPGLARSLLEHGYALFRPNPRGSFGQGEAFTQGNVRDFGHGDLRDILAGIDAAEQAAPIDDGRLGLTGGSYGGYMTMWAVTQTSRFKAAVAVAGVSDWQSYYGENGIDQWMIPYFGASVYQDPAAYARSSPIEFIRNARTPTFAYVGAQDIECPPPQTQEFWHALHELGVPSSYAIYPGEGHGLRDPAHLADAERRTLEWFEKYLR